VPDEEETKSVFIPNEEIRQEFVRAVKADAHKEAANLVKASDELLQETLNMNGQKVAALLVSADRKGIKNHGA